MHSLNSKDAKIATQEVPKVGVFWCFKRILGIFPQKWECCCTECAPAREHLISRALFSGQSDICRLILYLHTTLLELASRTSKFKPAHYFLHLFSAIDCFLLLVTIKENWFFFFKSSVSLSLGFFFHKSNEKLETNPSPVCTEQLPLTELQWGQGRDEDFWEWHHK